MPKGTGSECQGETECAELYSEHGVEKGIPAQHPARDRECWQPLSLSRALVTRQCHCSAQSGEKTQLSWDSCSPPGAGKGDSSRGQGTGGQQHGSREVVAQQGGGQYKRCLQGPTSPSGPASLGVKQAKFPG